MTPLGLTVPLAGIENGGDYVAAAYAVFLALVLIYVGIMASKLVRIEGKIADLAEKLGTDDQASSGDEKAPN